MRMRTTAGILVLAVLVMVSIMFMAACGGGGGTVTKDEARYAMKQLKSHMDDLLEDTEKAKSVSDIVDAINDFADGLERLLPKLKDMAQKSPDILITDEKIKEAHTQLQASIASLKEKMQKKMKSN